jgi:hypothetical protein
MAMMVSSEDIKNTSGTTSDDDETGNYSYCDRDPIKIYQDFPAD